MRPPSLRLELISNNAPSSTVPVRMQLFGPKSFSLAGSSKSSGAENPRTANPHQFKQKRNFKNNRSRYDSLAITPAVSLARSRAASAALLARALFFLLHMLSTYPSRLGSLLRLNICLMEKAVPVQSINRHRSVPVTSISITILQCLG
jgi:hypothetical protein